MLEQLTPIQLILLGAVAVALTLTPLLLMYRNRARDYDADVDRAEKHAARSRDILASTPDGIFLWDHATGGISCSRRLADLLHLENGTLSRYDDIRACFDEDNLQKLEQGVTLLRAKGTAFETMLQRGAETFQAAGVRATDTAKVPIADIVWVRKVAAALPEASADAAQPSRNQSGLEDRHLTALLDTLPVPMWLRDGDLNLAFLNRAAENVRGLDPSLADRARRDGAPAVQVSTLNHRNGEMQMSVTETPLSTDPERASSGTIGFAVPVPEATSAPTFAPPIELLRTLESGVAVFDADTSLIAANSAFADIWRIDPDWLETRPTMSDFLLRLRDLRRLPEVTDFRDFRRRELALFAGLDQVIEEDMFLPDGRTLRRRVGQLPDGGIVISCVDVSDRLSLQRSLKSLDKVQRTTLENLREGVAVFGGDGRLKLFNPRLADVWEIDEAELVADKRIADFVEMLGMRIAANETVWQTRKDSYISAALSRTASRDQLELVNGRVVAVNNIPLPDGASLLSYSDITDSFRVEHALRERARTLAEADRMKTEFIANVAMEVRTPLNTIMGFADMLSQQMFGELNRRQMDYATGIQDTANNMMGVLGDILDLATIEAGRMELNLDTADPHAVLVNAFNMIKERARQKNIRLEFDCPPDIGVVLTDSKRLTQIVFNLLSNAVWFTPKLGHVKLIAERSDPWLTITVSDSGPGIPQSERDRVFEPFAQSTAADHSGEGPGLGLTIVKRFVELHGGGVEIKSNKARGATVICRLPVDGENTEGVAPFTPDNVNLEDRAAE